MTRHRKIALAVCLCVLVATAGGILCWQIWDAEAIPSASHVELPAGGGNEGPNDDKAQLDGKLPSGENDRSEVPSEERGRAPSSSATAGIIRAVSASGLPLQVLLAIDEGKNEIRLAETRDGEWRTPGDLVFPITLTSPGHRQAIVEQPTEEVMILVPSFLLVLDWQGFERSEVDRVTVDDAGGEEAVDALSRCALMGFQSKSRWAIAIDKDCYIPLGGRGGIAIALAMVDDGRIDLEYDLAAVKSDSETIPILYQPASVGGQELVIAVDGPTDDTVPTVDISVTALDLPEPAVHLGNGYVLRISPPRPALKSSPPLRKGVPIPVGMLPTGVKYWLRAQSGMDYVGGTQFTHNGDVVSVNTVGPLRLSGSLTIADDILPAKVMSSVSWSTNGQIPGRPSGWESGTEFEIAPSDQGSFEIVVRPSILPGRDPTTLPASGTAQFYAAGVESAPVSFTIDSNGKAQLGEIQLVKITPDLAVVGLNQLDYAVVFREAPLRVAGQSLDQFYIVEFARRDVDGNAELFLKRDREGNPAMVVCGLERKPELLPSILPEALFVRLNQGFDGLPVYCQRETSEKYLAEPLRTVSVRLKLLRDAAPDIKVLLGWRKDGLLGTCSMVSWDGLVNGLTETLSLPDKCSVWWMKVDPASSSTSKEPLIDFTLSAEGEDTYLR